MKAYIYSKSLQPLYASLLKRWKFYNFGKNGLFLCSISQNLWDGDKIWNVTMDKSYFVYQSHLAYFVSISKQKMSIVGHCLQSANKRSKQEKIYFSTRFSFKKTFYFHFCKVTLRFLEIFHSTSSIARMIYIS